MKNFHNIYSLSKTLRFELKPLMVKTNDNKDELVESQAAIESFVAADKKKADAYREVKLYLDELHREFIRKAFTNFELSLEELDAAYKAFANGGHNEAEKEHLENIQKELRKKIKDHLNNDDIKALFGKKVIALLKDRFQSNEEAMEIINEFDKFTTYFGGYNQSRKNMYNMNIPERLINDNLPKHYKNVKDYQKIKELLPGELEQLSKDFQINTDELFSVNYFNKTMTQPGIDKYNEIIGGRSEKEGQKTKGLNEYINEYNMHHKTEKLPKFKQLYKQILSKLESNSFRYSEFQNKNELIEEIDVYYNELNQKVLSSKILMKLFENLASHNYDLNNIYISMPYINSISSKAFGQWDYIVSEIKNTFSHDKDMKKTIKALESEANDIKKKKFISLGILQQALPPKSEHNFTELIKHFAQMKAPQRNTSKQDLNLFENINEAYGKYLKDKDNINNIKVLLDAIKDLQNFVRVFIPDETVEADAAFYNVLDEQYEILRKIISLYNRARNLATKKPYSVEKFKLNFNCPTLLNGWSINDGEIQYRSVIFMKDKDFFLGILSGGAVLKNILKASEEKEQNAETYALVDYHQITNPALDLPHKFFSEKGKKEFCPNADLLEKHEKGCHKKGDSFDINFCHELIDFFKSSINKDKDWSKFNFHFSPTESYEDISGFYGEIEAQKYKLTFRNITASEIHELVKSKKLYLFKIYNKDFSEYSHGTPNLHTMYWRALFDEDNLKNVVYKLNGEAEIFFRKKSINDDKKFTHKENEGIACRRSKIKKPFPYDITKNKRFTVDKFLFHVPITLNFQANGRKNLNDLVKDYIKSSDDISVVGIDRGERNLLYYSLIDSKGNIKNQGSLDVISERFNTDYNCLLEKKEEKRKKAREEWLEIGKIKDLKAGYLSQAIHKIVELMIENNAIIVLENLNNGFKNSRTKIEKQIYQKFERMLIEKLNYLVIKSKKEKEEAGGILNAYQFTNEFESSKKLGLQSGFLFYVSPWNTSNIDPTTGFVNLFRTVYQNIEKTKEFISKFKNIRYNEKDGYFEFEVDNYEKFTDKAIGNKKNWVICTHGDKIVYEKINNQWIAKKEYNVTSEFRKLFECHRIRLDHIKEDIANITEANFFKRFLKLFAYTVQLRNSDKPEEKKDKTDSVCSIDEKYCKDKIEKGRKTDYILSPVKNKNGEFFDSRNVSESLPIDADANGAYNIARKGLMVIEQIKRDEKIKVSNKDWLNFAQKSC